MRGASRRRVAPQAPLVLNIVELVCGQHLHGTGREQLGVRSDDDVCKRGHVGYPRKVVAALEVAIVEDLDLHLYLSSEPESCGDESGTGIAANCSISLNRRSMSASWSSVRSLR